MGGLGVHVLTLSRMIGELARRRRIRRLVREDRCGKRVAALGWLPRRLVSAGKRSGIMTSASASPGAPERDIATGFQHVDQTGDPEYYMGALQRARGIEQIRQLKGRT